MYVGPKVLQMKNIIRALTIATIVLIFTSCNYITYIPRSKASVRRAAPSMLLLEKIADFRVEQHSWPVSTEDFISKGTKYYNAYKDFNYTETWFKIIDSNTMVFYFTGHIVDIEDYNASQKINLNSYNGRAKFFKQNDKFIWKLTMN